MSKTEWELTVHITFTEKVISCLFLIYQIAVLLILLSNNSGEADFEKSASHTLPFDFLDKKAGPNSEPASVERCEQ